MSRQISRKEFYEKIAEIFHISYDEAQDKWAEIIDWWVLEVQQYGGMNIPSIGQFNTRYKPEHEKYIVNYKHMYDSNEPPMILATIPEKLQITFAVNSKFKELVNGEDLSYKFVIKRKQERQLQRKQKEEEIKQLKRQEKADDALQKLMDKKGKK